MCNYFILYSIVLMLIQLQNIVEIIHKDFVANVDNFEDEDTGVIYDMDVLKMFWYLMVDLCAHISLASQSQCCWVHFQVQSWLWAWLK